MKYRIHNLVYLCILILVIFIGRALLAERWPFLSTFHLFDLLTMVGSLCLIWKGHRSLRKTDVLLAVGMGLLVGVGMMFASLYSPYPFLGLVPSQTGQALLRGILTTIVMTCGLVVMRRGGPVPFHLANGEWRTAGLGILLGLAIGLPLAVVNVFALHLTQGQLIQWQNPWAAMLDALQPGVVEEVTYRFALWGIFWVCLRKQLPEKSIWLAGVLAMLVHNFSHYDNLFLQSPLLALGMGLVMALLWGVPPLILARRRGLESAIAFHWIQDAARFLGGF